MSCGELRHARILLECFLICLILLMTGCTAASPIKDPPIEDPRHSLTVLNAPQKLRDIPIALLDIMDVPPEHVDLFFIPDDTAFNDEGGNWKLIPSPTVVRAKDVILVALQYAGLNVKTYSTLTMAKRDGATIALLGVVKTGHIKELDRVLIPGSLFNPGAVHNFHHVESMLEMQIVIIDLGKYKVLWQGNVESTNRSILETPFGYDYRKTKADAAMGSSESIVHALRVLLTQSYFEAAMKLIPHMTNALSGDPRQ